MPTHMQKCIDQRETDRQTNMCTYTERDTQTPPERQTDTQRQTCRHREVEREKVYRGQKNTFKL